MSRAQHAAAKKRISKDVIKSIEANDDIISATDILCKMGVVRACATLDKMFGLSAGFLLCVVALRAKEGGAKEKKILARAKKLKVRGSKGLVYERDKLFRETGIFAGM